MSKLSQHNNSLFALLSSEVSYKFQFRERFVSQKAALHPLYSQKRRKWLNWHDDWTHLALREIAPSSNDKEVHVTVQCKEICIAKFQWCLSNKKALQPKALSKSVSSINTTKLCKQHQKEKIHLLNYIFYRIEATKQILFLW